MGIKQFKKQELIFRLQNAEEKEKELERKTNSLVAENIYLKQSIKDLKGIIGSLQKQYDGGEQKHPYKYTIPERVCGNCKDTLYFGDDFAKLEYSRDCVFIEGKWFCDKRCKEIYDMAQEETSVREKEEIAYKGMSVEDFAPVSPILWQMDNEQFKVVKEILELLKEISRDVSDISNERGLR